MNDKQDWDRFQIDAALNETEPTSDNLELWAQWYDRKAAAAELLRDMATAGGNPDGANDAETLRTASIAGAAKLRAAKAEEEGR